MREEQVDLVEPPMDVTTTEQRHNAVGGLTVGSWFSQSR